MQYLIDNKVPPKNKYDISLQDIIKNNDKAILDSAFETIKQNYKCPKGTIDDSNKCEIEQDIKEAKFDNFKYEMDSFHQIPAQIADSKLIKYNKNISKYSEDTRLSGMRLIHRTGDNNHQEKARKQIEKEITNNTELGKYLNEKIISETKAFEENPVRLYRSGKYKNSIIESYTTHPDGAFTSNFEDVPPGNDFYKDYDELKKDGWKVLNGVLQAARYPEEYEVTLINTNELYKNHKNQKQNSSYLADAFETIKLNYNCPDSEKVGSGPGSCGGSSNETHENIAMFPSPPIGKSESGLEFYARLWKVDPEIYDTIKEKVEGSPEHNLFNKLGDKWLRNVDPEAREDAISVVQSNKLLKSYLLHEHFGLDVPEKTKLYRVGKAKTGMTNSFFPNKQVAEAYQKRMGVENIYEYEVPTNEVIPSLSGAGEIWVPSDVESINEIQKQDSSYLEDVTEFIKLNYNCPDSEKNGSGPGSCSGKTESHVLNLESRMRQKITEELPELEKNLASRQKELAATDKNSPAHKKIKSEVTTLKKRITGGKKFIGSTNKEVRPEDFKKPDDAPNINNVMEKYQNYTYKIINNVLRGDTTIKQTPEQEKATKQLIATMDKEMLSHTQKTPITVFRADGGSVTSAIFEKIGIGDQPSFKLMFGKEKFDMEDLAIDRVNGNKIEKSLNNLLVGEKFTEKGFMSTGKVEKNIKERFLNGSTQLHNYGIESLLEIEVPKGISALRMLDYTGISSELGGKIDEYVIDRDQTMVIKNVKIITNDNGRVYLHMKVSIEPNQKHNSSYLNEVVDFMKLNYKCPKGTVDDTNACGLEGHKEKLIKKYLKKKK